MVHTVILNFIGYIFISSTVLTFLMGKMLIFAFHSLFAYKIIETLMLYKFFIFFFISSSIFLFFFCPMDHFYFLFLNFLSRFFNDSSKTIFDLIFNYLFWRFDHFSIRIFQYLCWFFLSFFIFFFFNNRLKFLLWRW